MSLRTVVEARVSTTRLKQLTNPDDAAASSASSTKLDAACSDAAGEFEVYAQTVFDETDARHIATAVDLVILLLQERGAAHVEGLSAQREKIVQRLKDLALVTGRDRVLPTSAEETFEAIPAELFEDTTLNPQTPLDEDEDA